MTSSGGGVQSTPGDAESNRPCCTWCFHGSRKTWVAASHVVLFACVREHMTARALCEACAESDAAAVGEPFYCVDCIDADVERTDDGPLCFVTLVTTREDWMSQIKDGRIRMMVPR